MWFANCAMELAEVHALRETVHSVGHHRTTVVPRKQPRVDLCCRIAALLLILQIVLVQIVPLLVTPWAGTCNVRNKEVPFGLTLVALMPLYTCPWFVGCAIVALILHRDQYRPSSEAHFWTVWYLVITFIGCLGDGFQVLWRCGSTPLAHYTLYMWDVSWFAMLASWGVLGWLSVLKLRLMTVVAPRLMMLGQGASKVLLISCAITFCVQVLQNHGIGSYTFAFCFGLISSALSMGTICGCVVFSMELSARELREEALAIEAEDGIAENKFLALKRLRNAEATIAAAGISTIVSSIVIAFSPNLPPFLGRCLQSLTCSIDPIANTLSSIALSGLLQEDGHSSSFIINLGVASQRANRFREIEMKLVREVGGSAGSALVIAALLGNANAHDAFETAALKFRCIRWEVLSRRRDVIIGGAPLDVLGPGESDLYSLSEPCQLGNCDAFFSHSWHDDPLLKWEALAHWCEEFMVEHGRYPRIWLDKVCIDQANIEVDLQCLPVFLAGCNTMFCASGSTYHKRLWCLVEMLVYRAMLNRDGDRDLPVVWLIGNTNDDCAVSRHGWLNFNVRDCECFCSRDKEVFLRVVSAYPGGKERFNRFIRGVATSIERDFVGGEFLLS